MKTTNYEISKELAEIGFKAENDFYWVKWNEGLPELVYKSEIMPALIEKVPAYDLETLINALPDKITTKFQHCDDTGEIWECEEKLSINQRGISYSHDEDDRDYYRRNYGYYCRMYALKRLENKSLADTAGRMIIELHEAGIINFKKMENGK